VVVSSTLLQPNQSLTLRWLQMALLSLANPSTGADTLQTTPTADGVCVFPGANANLITAGYGLCYLGLYLNFNALVSPAGQAAQEVPLILGDATTLPPLSAVRPTNPSVYAAPGAYSFVLTNNTTDTALRLTVGGQVVLSLGPPAVLP
jgi:hypothetical protein